MSIVVAFDKTIDLYNQNQHWIAIILWSEITESILIVWTDAEFEKAKSMIVL